MLEIGGPHGELHIFQGKTQAWETGKKESTTLTAWFRTTHTLTEYILRTITLVRAQQLFLNNPTYYEGWPEPYVYTVYDRILGDFPAKNTVYTP